MPITPLALQRRAVETGRIRIGQQVKTAKGKLRPEKLDRFRFTTSSERVARAIAAHLGGEPEPWTNAPTPGQWQVLTPSTEINVAIPPGDNAVSQWMELWSGGGCARRCDGETETLKNTPCLCPRDQVERALEAQEGRACKPTTRISVIIPDLPGIGVFRLESHGWNAAAELAGTAELLAAARGAGVIVPAVLRLEQRQSKKGGQTRNFAVPVLEVLPTLRDLTALQSGSGALAGALPPPTGSLPAIGGGQPREVGHGPAGERPHQQRAADAAAAPGAPQSPAEVAVAAAATSSLTELTDLARLVQARKWGEEAVERDGAWEPLWEALMHRKEELEAERRRAEQGPPPEPEDDPTVTDAPRDAPPMDLTEPMGDW